MAAGEPLVTTLWLGQINLLVLWLVAEDLLARDPRRRGLLCGVAAGVKLTPALFVVYLLVATRQRTAGGSGAGPSPRSPSPAPGA